MKRLYVFISLILLVHLSIGQYNVTFSVDMNDYTGTFTTVYVNGDYNSWCGSCNPLADPDQDGIWEGTFPITADSIEFKYTLDGWNAEEVLMPGLPCTKTTAGFTNRFETLTGSTVLPTVCWESCDPCGSSTTNNITFKVDMNDYTGSFDSVYVNGTYNSWCGYCNPMSDLDQDGIWELTIPLDTDSIEYKFTLDGWTVQETLTPGSPCTKTSFGYTNRFLVTDDDIVLPAVCWESCDSCTGTPVNAAVTFRVDMNEYTGSYTNVHLNGTFNGWCGSCAPMDDSDGDGVYELEVTVPTDTIEYKFTLDGWTVEETFAGGEPCTMTTGTFINRFLIPKADTVLPDVCWESCDPCSVGIDELSDIESFEIYPTHSSGKFNYRIYFQDDQMVDLTISNLVGQSVYSEKLNGTVIEGEIDISNSEKGMYLFRIQTQKDVITKKIVIK